MARPTVSVVIPCYNQAQYLRECLDSVMAQTFQDFEVIIVDDGSTDERSQEIFGSLNYPKTKIIHQKNKGPIRARNTGISHAKGQYILPLDADDKIAPSVLKQAVEVLHTKPNMGIVGGQTEFFGAKTGRFQLPDYAFPLILARNCLVATCMFRKSDWEKVGGYNPNMKDGLEDYDFWLSLIELGRDVYLFDTTFLYYRQQEISRSTQLNSKKYQKMRRQVILNHPKLYKKYPAIRKKLLSITSPLERIVFVSVVRNQEMYRHFVKDNPHNQGADFVWYDNTEENITIPKRYNDFLEHYDYRQPAWFVFCHEDWETKSDWLYRLNKLDKKFLYGICGTKLALQNNKKAVKYVLGELINSNKKGTSKRMIGTKVKTGTPVDTLDCLCMIIHSTLIKKYHIRFDEQLSWHLYAEEMCIRMKEKHHIPSRILQIRSQHWSWGEVNEEFDRSFDYLVQKFGDTKNIYSFTCSNTTIKNIGQFVDTCEKQSISNIQFSLFGFPIWTRHKYVDN